jgi:hypothetical protein
MREFGSLSPLYHIGRVRLTDTALHSSHPGFAARPYMVGTTFPNRTLDDDTVSIDKAGLSQIILDSIQSVVHELFSPIKQLLNDSELQLIPGGILQVSGIPREGGNARAKGGMCTREMGSARSEWECVPMKWGCARKKGGVQPTFPSPKSPSGSSEWINSVFSFKIIKLNPLALIKSRLSRKTGAQLPMSDMTFGGTKSRVRWRS